MSDFSSAKRIQALSLAGSGSRRTSAGGRLRRGNHPPAPEATLLVNVSNVAWFGDSLAPAQHLQISRMRAIETGRTMLRATNTG